MIFFCLFVSDPATPVIYTYCNTLSRHDARPICRVVVVDGFAIYDRIETRPEHRGRGLARAVMMKLEAIGREKGAVRGVLVATPDGRALYEGRSEEHTSELQSLMRISYAVFCLKKKTAVKHTI